MARTKPIGVRFDPDKLEFVKTKEKLSSNQQVVDLLVNKYWWEHKMPHVTAKESPPLELKTKIDYKPITPESFDGKRINITNDEPKQWVEPKPDMIPMGNFDILKEKILKTETVSQIDKVMKEVKTALLNFKQKQALEQVAKKHSESFYTD